MAEEKSPITYTTPRNRAEMLRAMDFLARSFNDERLTEVWLMGGVPDGTEADEDFLELARDSDTFWHCVCLFNKLVTSKEFKDSGFFC